MKTDLAREQERSMKLKVDIERIKNEKMELELKECSELNITKVNEIVRGVIDERYQLYSKLSMKMDEFINKTELLDIGLSPVELERMKYRYFDTMLKDNHNIKNFDGTKYVATYYDYTKTRKCMEEFMEKNKQTHNLMTSTNIELSRNQLFKKIHGKNIDDNSCKKNLEFSNNKFSSPKCIIYLLYLVSKNGLNTVHSRLITPVQTRNENKNIELASARQEVIGKQYNNNEEVKADINLESLSNINKEPQKNYGINRWISPYEASKEKIVVRDKTSTLDKYMIKGPSSAKGNDIIWKYLFDHIRIQYYCCLYIN